MRFLLSLLLIISSLALTVDAQRKRRAPAPKPAPKEVFTIKGDADRPAKIPVRLDTREVVEKYTSSYELNSDGTGTEVREFLQRCASEACLPQLSSFKQIYNGDLEKMRIIEAYVLKADGTRVNLPASAITDRLTDQAEAAPGFSSMREVQAKFADLKAGDATFVKAEKVVTRATFEKRYDALEYFPVTFDWKSVEISVSAPANFPLFIEADGLDGGKLADENGRSRWQYKKSNITRIELEPAMSDIMSISPRFVLSTYSDANALGSVFWENAKSKTLVTPEIQTLADEITKGAATPSEQAAAIYAWVNKNIRYLSIVLDRGGWVPHSATEIIHNRYGDCKDYTTVIHTLLKAKGIDSTPVLIRADYGEWFPTIPTADFFNHLILYIPSLNVFADATTPNTRLGLVPQTLVGKRGILAGEKTGVIQLPKDNPADNQIVSDLTIDFADNGSLKGRTRNTYVGRSEIIFRPLFASSFLKQESAMFVRMMLAYHGLDGEGDIISVGNPHKVGEPFHVEVETRLGNFTTFLSKGRLELPPGLNMLSLEGLEGLVSGESRKTNLTVGALKVRENVKMNLPATVTLGQAPAGVKFSNAVGSLNTTYETKEGSLYRIREFVITKDVIEPKEYPLLKELIAKVGESGTVSVDYTADPSLLKAKSKELQTRNKELRAAVNKLKETPASSVPPALRRRVENGTLTAADLVTLEKLLTTKPDELDVRLALVRHYSLFSTPALADKFETAQVRHRVWLIENSPDSHEEDFYIVARRKLSPASAELIKKAWLAKVEREKGTLAVRSNAINALREIAPESAAAIAEESVKLDPDNYNRLVVLVEVSVDVMNKETAPEAIERSAKKALEYGRRALEMIKTERSEERDASRAVVLTNLCAAAIKANDLDAATSYAQELILDFGQASGEWSYDQSAHVGNTTLGLVELRRNNLAKAKEHLLASVRAPLRQGYNDLLKIDTRLARELYEKGEKATVQEFLKLCLELPNYKVYPESYADEIKDLKLRQDQITKGIKPNFEFKKPLVIQ